MDSLRYLLLGHPWPEKEAFGVFWRVASWILFLCILPVPLLVAVVMLIFGVDPEGVSESIGYLGGGALIAWVVGIIWVVIFRLVTLREESKPVKPTKAKTPLPTEEEPIFQRRVFDEPEEEQAAPTSQEKTTGHSGLEDKLNALANDPNAPTPERIAALEKLQKLKEG